MLQRASCLKVLMFGAAACGFLTAGTAAFAQQQQARLFGPSKFDGMYSVEVTTEDGSCGSTRLTVKVSDGQVASVSPNTVNISALGLIESDGVVSMTFRGGTNQYAHVGGEVKGRSGKGTWSSPTLLCGGVWRAQKVK